MSRNRPHVYDVPFLLLPHDFQAGVGAVQDAFNVYIHHSVPLIYLVFDYFRNGHEACVVYPHVNPAKFSEGGLGDFFHLQYVGNVGFKVDSFSSLFPYGGGYFL